MVGSSVWVPEELGFERSIDNGLKIGRTIRSCWIIRGAVMDRLASINAFVHVADNGGFSAAARSLGVSTTTVSDQVQALENALGVRLLNRTTRRVNLTE